MLILLIDIVDYGTDPLLDFSLFYLTPVLFCTWFGGRRMGSFMAGISAISWLFTERLAGTMQGNYLPYYYWDCFTRLSFYWVVVKLLASLREQLRSQRSLARTDNVTGSANARHFRELLERETQRFSRYKTPFTLVYFDIDNFKEINDALGHAAGDEVLKTIAEQAQQAMRRLQQVLLAAMAANKWNVTFSMGGISCVEHTSDVLTLIQLADALMYQVKHTGKNSIKHMTCSEAKAKLFIESSKILI